MPMAESNGAGRDAATVYAAQTRVYEAKRAEMERRSAVLSRWRLATFLPALGLLILALSDPEPATFAMSAALFAVFGVLVVRHARVEERAAWFEALRTVNARGTSRLHRQWDALPPAPEPRGLDLETHPYATDLDLFGRASIYQWLGPAATELGSRTLADWLLAPASPEAVQLRQDAVEELAPLTDWREELGAYGTITREARPMPIGRFLEWAESSQPLMPFISAIQPAVLILTALIAILGALHWAGLTPAL